VTGEKYWVLLTKHVHQYNKTYNTIPYLRKQPSSYSSPYAPQISSFHLMVQSRAVAKISLYKPITDKSSTPVIRLYHHDRSHRFVKRIYIGDDGCHVRDNMPSALYGTYVLQIVLMCST
jgi:hypothetical protein